VEGRQGGRSFWNVARGPRRGGGLRGAIDVILVVALVGLALAVPPAWAQLAQEPVVFYERDFAQDQALAARPHDIVVLKLEATRRGVRENLARYRLDAGTHTFCLDTDDGDVTGLVVEDAAGRSVLELPLPVRQERGHRLSRAPAPVTCAETILPSDTYQLRFSHDGSRVTGASRVAFVQARPPNPSLVDHQGKPAAGWWALRPDPGLDSARREGRVTLGPLATGVRPVIADFTSKRIDDSSLFDVQDLHRPRVKTTSGGLPLDLAKLESSRYWTLGADDPARTQTFFQDITPLVVTDLGQYQVQLGVRRADLQVASIFLSKTTASATTVMLNYDQPRPDPARPAPVEVLFRFFPDGTKIGELQEGEIALFQECDYRGKAAVFAGRIPNLAELSSPVVTLAASAASVKLGNNTGVILHAGPIFTGTRQIVEVDTPCLDATPIKNNTTASLEVRLLAPTILLSTRSCKGCRLIGVDLSGYDLSGVDLEGANLTRANLTGISLENVKLSNATLDEATGFAGADHSLVDLSNASLKRVNFSNALLYGAKLNGANLEGANLSHAFLNNNPTAKIRNAASLSGAHLKNVNLSGAQLSGADFGNASFYGDNPAADLGCDTTKGFLNGCASAAAATMNTTNFSGAYLYGVDFQEATIQGVQFTNAVLVGASFADATVSADPKLGTLTHFTAAFLQGANLAATMNQVSLVDAFVDFTSGGNNLTLLLDGTHTAFHGWKTPGQSVCLFVSYGHPTIVPETNSTLTCPDGGAGPCGPAASPPCGAPGANPRWRSGVHDLTQANPPATYSECATYTMAAQTPICPNTDDDW
jgi:uncharacterized protein YjbI with pentapeptide repeats